MASDDIRPAAIQSTFGDLLKRLRVAIDLSQEDLAERTGLSARGISDLERGRIHHPRRDTVQLLADGLRLAGPDRDTFVAVARRRASPDSDAFDSPRHLALPLPPTPIVGRLKETAAATALLLHSDVRLLTLIGPGGVGKTRLALDVAARAADAFPSGAVFVDLAPVADPALILSAIAQTLGVQAGGMQPLPERLVGFLADQRLLLVLDNFEHLAVAAPVVAELLGACPNLTVLATSREPLHLRVEQEYLVAPLALPDLSPLPPADELACIPAVELFVRRAEAADRGFALTERNARAVAEIAVRLDGLPLAIELAAARVKILSPSALLARLEHRLSLLTGGARDLPVRQQTLRATLDWSHDLLTEDEQRLFRRLAIFAGGFTLESAEALGRGQDDRSLDPRPSTLDSVQSLVDKSLLRALDAEDDGPDPDAPRFAMLETLREYGLECLAAADEEATVRERHAAWCLDLAERSQPELTGPDQARWLAKLDAEHDNLRAVLGWAIGRRDGEPALRLVGALHRFWHLRGHYAEGRRWLEQALALDEDGSSAVRAAALHGAAVIAHFQGDYEQAAARGEEALARFRALGDTAGVAAAHRYLGMAARAQGDFERAAALDEEALRLYRDLGDRHGVGGMLNNLGLVAYYQGDYTRAATLHEEALALRRALGDRNGAAYSLTNRALVAHAQGDDDRAAALQEEALELWWSVGNKDGLAHCFENLALIATSRHELERVARLFGAAEALRARIGAPGRPNDRESNERFIIEPRAQLGEAAFAAAREEGRAMALEEVIDYALERGRPVPTGDPRAARGDD